MLFVGLFWTIMPQGIAKTQRKMDFKVIWVSIIMLLREIWLKIFAMDEKSYLESPVDLESVSVGAAVGELDRPSCLFPHLHLGIMHKRLTL